MTRPQVRFWPMLGPLAKLQNGLRDVPRTLHFFRKFSPRLINRPNGLPAGLGEVPGHPKGPPRDDLGTIFGGFLRSILR